MRLNEQKMPRLQIVLRIVFVYLPVTLFFTVLKAEVTIDGSLKPDTAGSLPGPNFNIPASLGLQLDKNLFHSFGKFNLTSSESATFSSEGAPNPANIRNVIARVTGGQSSIDGLLRSIIPEANLFFLNPAGVFIGQNAVLDVQGSFHVSTADYLKFSDGSVFNSIPSPNDVLTVESPIAFGFLSPNPAGITVGKEIKDNLEFLLQPDTPASLYVPDGKTVSIVGGDIQIFGRKLDESENAIPVVISAPGGVVNLVSVKGENEVNFGGENDEQLTVNFEDKNSLDLGVIELGQAAVIHTDANQSGKIVIRSSQFSMKDSSLLLSDTINEPGGGIDIKVNELVALDDSSIRSRTKGIGNAGTISIESSDSLNISIKNNSEIVADSFAGSSGDPGIISIKAEGPLKILSDQTSIITSGSRNLVAFSPGTIDLISNSSWIEIEGGFYNTSSRSIFSESGMITIKAKDYISIKDNAKIISTNFEGNNSINSAINIDSGSFIEIYSSILSSNIINSNVLNTNSPGVGFITLLAPESITLRGSSIESGYLGNSALGVAGNIRIETKTLNLLLDEENGLDLSPFGINILLRSSIVSTSTVGSGDAGNIELNIESLNMQRALINSGAFSTLGLRLPFPEIEVVGNSGNIHITGYKNESASNITLKDRSGIFANSNQGKRGGNINIDSDSIYLNDSAISAGIESVTNENAGEIVLTANDLTLERGAIGTRTSGNGSAGNVLLNVNFLNLKDKSILRSDSTTQANGKAGLVSIQGRQPNKLAQRVLLETDSLISTEAFNNESGDITVSAEQVIIDQSLVSSAVIGGENVSGDIVFDIHNLFLKDNAQILSENLGLGDAGNISAKVVDSFISVDSQVSTNASQADGGNIKFNVGNITDSINSEITTSVGGGEGTGGNINLDSRFFIQDSSRIQANAIDGPGGNIKITANAFLATPNSIVEASSVQNIDGEVEIISPNTDVESTLTPLPVEFEDAASRLGNICSQRRGVGKSTFGVSPREGLPLSPDDFVPLMVISSIE